MPRNGKACKFLLCRSRSKHHPHKKFHPFIKPWMDRERCLRWISATGREDLIPDFIDKASYVCEDHFVDGSPSVENPDPLPHNFMESIIITPSIELFCPKSPVDNDSEEAGVSGTSEQLTSENSDRVGCVDSTTASTGKPDHLPHDYQASDEDAPAEHPIPFEECFIKTESFRFLPGEDA